MADTQFTPEEIQEFEERFKREQEQAQQQQEQQQANRPGYYGQMAQDIAGAVPVAVGAANDFLSTPLGRATEIVGGGGALGYGVAKGAQWLKGANDARDAAQAQRVSSVIKPGPVATPSGTVTKIPVTGGTPVASTILGPNGQPINAQQYAQTRQQIAAAAQAAEEAKVAATGGQAAVQGSNFLENVASKFGRVSQVVKPVLTSVAQSPIGRVVGKSIPVAGTALSTADAIERARAGDYLGSALAGAGGVAAQLGPETLGLGTLASLGLNSANLVRDRMRTGKWFEGPGQIPARAHGGPVTQGHEYLVGEHGPEIFRAPASGHIIPHDHLHQAVKVAKPHRHKSNSPQEADARKKGYGEWISPNSGNRHTMETLPNGIHREVTYERSTGRARQAEYWHPHGHKHN